jgi:hypothetical protein
MVEDLSGFDDRIAEIFLPQVSVFNLKIMNRLAICSNNQRDVVAFLFVGLFLLGRRDEVCKITCEEVLREGDLVYEDEIGVVFQVVVDYVCEHPTGLYVLGCILFDGEGFDVVERIPHFSKMP